MPDQSQNQSQDKTVQLMEQLGSEVLHEIQPQGLKLLAEILHKVAGHLEGAADTHPDKHDDKTNP